MQMLLHLNEDFDDDLLLDALETLNCWLSDFIKIFISYFNIICNNSSLFPQRKFPLFYPYYLSQMKFFDFLKKILEFGIRKWYDK